MSGSELKQRLAAIMAADAVGYSRLMSLDERATVVALDAARLVFHAKTMANQGRVVDTAGDSVLAVFETTAGAMNAALQIQAELHDAGKDIPKERRMLFRVGIHSGDVMEKADGSVYGDGVNIAARLQALAEPGGVMVSESIHTAVRGKVNVSFEDQGEQQVKNIAHPVRAWRVQAKETSPSPTVSPIDLSLPDKPSIAVLPLVNMSGDPEQEYFTDGVSEDIITELSRFHSLFVIARNSSFTYKGKAVDVRTVSKELGVRYVLEGSIRRSGNRIRVTAQLIDALTGNHIWAEKYDRVVEDIFAVQEELTECIVAAIAPQIDSSELTRAARRRPGSLSAYELALRARPLVLAGWEKSDAKAREAGILQARAALAIDPDSLLALETLAWGQLLALVFTNSVDSEAAWQEGMQATSRAIALAQTGRAHAIKAMLLAYAPAGRRWEEGRIEVKTAYRLNAQDSWTNYYCGFFALNMGDAPEAIGLLERSLRINPRDPTVHMVYEMLAAAHFMTKDYRTGMGWAMRATTAAPESAIAHGYVAGLHVGLGEVDKAKVALESLRRLAPELLQRWLKGGIAIADEKARDRATIFVRVAAGLEDPSAADAVR